MGAARYIPSYRDGPPPAGSPGDRGFSGACFWGDREVLTGNPPGGTTGDPPVGSAGRWGFRWKVAPIWPIPALIERRPMASIAAFTDPPPIYDIAPGRRRALLRFRILALGPTRQAIGSPPEFCISPASPHIRIAPSIYPAAGRRRPRGRIFIHPRFRTRHSRLSKNAIAEVTISTPITHSNDNQYPRRKSCWLEYRSFS